MDKILYPVFTQVLLTFFTLSWLGYLRVIGILSGEIKPESITLGQNAWPVKTTQVGRNFQNQLEMPILFYAVVAFILITHQTSSAYIFWAWVFALSRIAHMLVHTTINNLYLRLSIFSVGVTALVIMWGMLFFSV